MKYVFFIFALISAACILSTRSSPVGEKANTDFKPKNGEIVVSADVQGDASGASAGYVRAVYNQLWGSTDDIHVETVARAQKNFGRNPSDAIGGNVKLSIPVTF